MDSMRGLLSCVEGAGSSSRGVRDGDSEGSGPGGLLGDPLHVEWRVRVSTRVRGTASDGGGGGDGFPFPLLLRPPQGVERASPSECRDPWGVEGKRSHPKNSASMTVGLGGPDPPAYSIHPHKSVGLGFRKGPWKGTPFRRPYEIHWMRSLVLCINGHFYWRQPLGPPDGPGAVVAV